MNQSGDSLVTRIHALKPPIFRCYFGDEPTMTLERAKEARQKGFQAAKFGWGTIGTGTASEDQEHFQAAREGLGHDGILLVDTGQIFGMMWRKLPKNQGHGRGKCPMV